MELLRVIGIAVTVSVAILTVKGERPELAFALSVAAGMLILSLLLSGVAEIVSAFSGAVEKSGIGSTVYVRLLKMVGIGYLTETASETVEDFGNKSLASKIVLAGRIGVFLLAMPVFRELLSVVSELL